MDQQHPAADQNSTSDQRDRLTEQQLTQLRQLSTEVQDLQEMIQAIRAGQITISFYAAYIKQAVADVTALVDKLKGMDDSSVHGDAIRHVRNILEQMNCYLVLTDPQSQLSAEDKL